MGSGGGGEEGGCQVCGGVRGGRIGYEFKEGGLDGVTGCGCRSVCCMEEACRPLRAVGVGDIKKCFFVSGVNEVGI